MRCGSSLPAATFCNNLTRYDAAIQDFCDALAAGLTDPKIYNLRARCYRCIKKYELAEIDLTHAIAADPQSIDFLVNRSQCYYETREFDAAVSAAASVFVFL